MKKLAGPLLPLLLAFLVAAASPLAAQDQAKLKYKGVQKWTYILPNEMWSSAAGSVAVPHAGGDGFATALDGMKLLVDTTGDGRTNDVVKGVAGKLTLRGKNSEGDKLTYDVRFKKEGTTWKYSSSGLMQGRIGGELISIIDQNNNGVWNEYGVDAMIVGKSQAACFLSSVVNLKGNLYNFEVAADGRSMTISPYEGEVGTLDLQSGFKSYGKLISVVVSDGQKSFDLANEKKGLKVPAGSYTISGGFCKKGNETARIRTGQMQPLEVAAEKETELAWGAPVQVEFAYTIENGTLKVPPPPANVKYFGAAGEEYFDWQPDATSPEIIITDEKGREVGKGRFGGC
jgi:hypothetical protein